MQGPLYKQLDRLVTYFRFSAYKNCNLEAAIPGANMLLADIPLADMLSADMLAVIC